MCFGCICQICAPQRDAASVTCRSDNVSAPDVPQRNQVQRNCAHSIMYCIHLYNRSMLTSGKTKDPDCLHSILTYSLAPASSYFAFSSTLTRSLTQNATPSYFITHLHLRTQRRPPTIISSCVAHRLARLPLLLMKCLFSRFSTRWP